MGGRLILTTIQVTLIFRKELTGDEVEILLDRLKDQYRSHDLFVDLLLDEYVYKDVEV